MIAVLDVHYPETGARAACVVLEAWDSASASEERVVTLEVVEPYVPGQFFRRELPCLQAVLSVIRAHASTVIVDGYVWLDRQGRPGLGAHLFEALGKAIPVVGVAKAAFGEAGTSAAVEVLRGQSKRPLFVTSAGIDASEAAAKVKAMAGPARLPWALGQVDALSRGRRAPGAERD
ncbi:MAG TPA: endonuclease V [Myxococcales bacterium]